MMDFEDQYEAESIRIAKIAFDRWPHCDYRYVSKYTNDIFAAEIALDDIYFMFDGIHVFEDAPDTSSLDLIRAEIDREALSLDEWFQRSTSHSTRAQDA